LSFGDYPIRDYSRVSHEVAVRTHRGVGTHEALRRTARDDLGEFTASPLGRVMTALVVDARSLLLRYPDAYERCTVGQTATVEPNPRGVRLRYTGMHGACSYTVGQVEGMVLAYQPTCRILGSHDPTAATLELDVHL
ncbi:MAG: DUF2378 family protein, partial [Deltaproteobacteria bacterium]|nr:DUF2378 family protein [Deltaproteobacteria bacterium]